jgi:hypothetical protein
VGRTTGDEWTSALLGWDKTICSETMGKKEEEHVKVHRKWIQLMII